MSAPQTRTRSAGKLRAPRQDTFTSRIASIAAICFCLGALHGLLCDQPAQIKEHGLAPVPFHLKQSVSQLAATGDHQRRMMDLPNRKKVKLFIGIFTNPSSPKDKYGKRRKAIRDTFLDSLTAVPDSETKFVVGRSTDKRASRAFAQEVSLHPDQYFHLDMEECYRCLPEKTLSFFLAVHQQYNAEWIFKVDDDVYLSPDRIPLAVEQWDVMQVDYVGCMFHGEVNQEPQHRWYEPAWRLLGAHNSLSAYGSIYALRQKVVSEIIVPNINSLRKLATEDTTIGKWMIAFNVTFFEDMRLCYPKCHPHSLATLSIECTGLCHPEKDMYKLHKTHFCQRSITSQTRLAFMKSYPGHERMDALKQYVDNSSAISRLERLQRIKRGHGIE